jgi:hypothetical protein
MFTFGIGLRGIKLTVVNKDEIGVVTCLEIRKTIKDQRLRGKLIIYSDLWPFGHKSGPGLKPHNFESYFKI